MARRVNCPLPLTRLSAWGVAALLIALAPSLVLARSPAIVSSPAVVPGASTQAMNQVGRLASIQVIDRETGAALPIYEYQGEYWVVGMPGNKYAISMQKRGGTPRALVVTSVDGINVISGQTAAYDQTGYVLSGHSAWQITGWRKSMQEVAAFAFAAPGQSYAAKTGRAGNLGVIGLAVFREKQERPVPPAVVAPEYERKESARADATADKSSRESTGNATRSAPPAQESAAAAAKAPAPSAMAPGLGTEHGQREYSVTRNTSFERASAVPDEVIQVRYDTLENMLRRGVLAYAGPQPLHGASPNPFPSSAGFVADPPRVN